MNCLQNSFTPAGRRGNLVYLTKVFYDAEENSSPILTALTTTAASFDQQLSIGSAACSPSKCTCQGGCHCGCQGQHKCQDTCCQDPCCNMDNICKIVCCCCGNDGCSNVTVNASTTFDINHAYVITRSFGITTPTLPADLAVTVDGVAITDVSQSGGQFIGDISGIMPEISKCPCSPPCSDICPGHFVLISATGPWSLTATIVLEGTLYSGGNACQFRLCYSTADGTPISVTGNPSFAICGAEIPCQISNMAPSLQFDFGACASILNPTLTAAEDGAITLSGSLVVTPQVRMQVTRPSLFNLNAREVCLPCDDIGQCNPCDTWEAECFNSDECCCGQPSVNRIDELLDQRSAVNCQEPAADGRCHSDDNGCITCQSCETNGYSF